MDEVAQTLAAYNKELVSVDFWKTYSLTPIGVRALHICSKLEEVDLGWW
jgi:F-box/leucine-rich repeat protein 4